VRPETSVGVADLTTANFATYSELPSGGIAVQTGQGRPPIVRVRGEFGTIPTGKVRIKLRKIGTTQIFRVRRG
jgi:hypothetical protein